MTPQAHNPEITNAKYVSFVSYRKSGQAVATPVWITPFEDGYGFTYKVFSIYLWFTSRFGKSKWLPEAAVILKITP